MKYANIAIDVPLRTLFTYRVPKEMEQKISRGQRVFVLFGKKKMIGICLEVTDKIKTSQKTGEKDFKNKIKDLQAVLDEEVLWDDSYLSWLEFAADYYCAPVGQVLAQAIPPYYFDVKKINSVKRPRSRAIDMTSSFVTKSVELTREQNKIFQEIIRHDKQFYPALIHGITGSGKTEIYIQLIRKVLEQKKSALFLVPEIGLTPQMLARLNHHFKGHMLVYHSGLTKNQRWHQWQTCLDEAPKVLVGTRSALFAPFKNLGLILVDEEHDHSYKQEERFRYHARDLAISRAHQLRIPVVMGSATPSLETYHQACLKKYHFFELTERVGTAQLPRIRVIDFGKEREQTGSVLLLSKSVHDSIDSFFKQKKQMMLFVGQRGFAQNAYCVSCGAIQLCPNCSVGLKYHKPHHQLKCHYCDYQIPFEGTCSQCQKKALTLMGFGTQSIEQEIKDFHPRLRIARMDSDTIANLASLQNVLGAFAKHEYDLLIGTQMISKGHDFDNVGFVGVLGIDAHLGLPDFRAGERSFQNLVQVAGRSGRTGTQGLVLVQSLMPEHLSVKMGVAQDYQKFAEVELALRKALNYPPFSRIVQFRFLAVQEKRLKNFMQNWKPFLDKIKKQLNASEVQVLGPTEMPIAKVRGKYRYHMIVKAKRGIRVTDLVRYIVDDLDQKKPSGIQYQIDVDAVGLM